MQRFIEEMVESGAYATPEDVVHAGLAYLDQQLRICGLDAEDLEAIYPDLRRKVAEGLASLRAGRGSDGEAFFEELEREDTNS
jgi:Arc/MetJ-type ribon-helix-helix transcriptional regulator